MKRNQIIVLLIVTAGVIAWALFRPERLFVNAKVNESLPSTTSNAARLNCGSGFLGVSLATHLTQAGYSVVVLSRNPPAVSGPWPFSTSRPRTRR